MRIRKQQTESIAIAFSEQLRDIFARELRTRGLVPAAISDEELKSAIKRDQSAANGIEITEIRDVWRFLVLKQLPEFKNGSKVVKAAITKILNDREYPSKTRLDFIEQSIIKSLGRYSLLRED